MYLASSSAPIIRAKKWTLVWLPHWASLVSKLCWPTSASSPPCACWEQTEVPPSGRGHKNNGWEHKMTEDSPTPEVEEATGGAVIRWWEGQRIGEVSGPAAGLVSPHSIWSTWGDYCNQTSAMSADFFAHFLLLLSFCLPRRSFLPDDLIWCLICTFSDLLGSFLPPSLSLTLSLPCHRCTQSPPESRRWVSLHLPPQTLWSFVFFLSISYKEGEDWPSTQVMFVQRDGALASKENTEESQITWSIAKTWA